MPEVPDSPEQPASPGASSFRAGSEHSTTAQFPVPEFARRIYWAVYAQTPAGRRERRILTNPDVREALEQAAEEFERWRRSFDA